MANSTIHAVLEADIIMLLKDLFKNIPYKNLAGGTLQKIVIKSVVTDSRKARKGSLFIALKGVQTDGHLFLDDIIKEHPACLAVETGRNISTRIRRSKIPILAVENTRLLSSRLADRWFGHPGKNLNIFGVTGTNGKTTTTQTLATLLGPKEQSGFLSTVAYQYSDIKGYSDMTTPDPWTLHARFREMVDKGVKNCVIEVSSHALDQSRVGGIRFRRNVFTNLTQDHLDYHKTMGKYFQAKQRLFLEIGSDRDPVINKDDKYGKRLIRQLKNKAVTYAIEDETADYIAEHIAIDIDKTTFILRTPHLSMDIRLPLLGKHNVYNFLAAAAVAMEEGIPKEELIERVALITPVCGRLEPVGKGQPFKIFVDYAHTPDAIERILSFLGSVTKGRLITVFGCGGDRDRAKRPSMGRAAEKWSDIVIVTSDNPRSEVAEKIIQDIRDGRKGDGRDCWIEISDRRDAIRQALKLAQDDDVVAVLGKGHETVQVIGKDLYPFSDRRVICEELQAKSYALHQ